MKPPKSAPNSDASRPSVLIFVHGLITRRADLTGAVFFTAIFFVVAFLTNLIFSSCRHKTVVSSLPAAPAHLRVHPNRSNGVRATRLMRWRMCVFDHLRGAISV